MALQGGTSKNVCRECGVKEKFFKMFQCFRKEHVWTDEDGRTMATIFCVGCELKIRQDEWSEFTEEEKRVAGEGYATMKQVKIDLKARAKEGWAARSEHIINAKLSIQALRNAAADDSPA